MNRFRIVVDNSFYRSQYEKQTLDFFRKKRYTKRYKSLLESSVFKRFDNNIPKDIINIYNILVSHNYELYLVGGAVRDYLRGDHAEDFDLATSASPKQIEQVFQAHREYRLIPTGIEHGTWTLLINQKHYEITSYRIDGSYSNNRRPDQVSFTDSLIEDLSRRDFTINAIAVNPHTREIIDPFHGQEDIQQKMIRTVGNPIQRFSEDALRMLRACRFASKLEYTIEQETYLGMQKTAHTIQFISQERIREELLKILSSKNPAIGIDFMLDSGLLDYILPELKEGYGVDQNQFHKYDVYRHNVMVCVHMPPDDLIARFAALLHDIGKPRAKNFALKIGNGNVFYNHEIIGAKMVKSLMGRLKFSNEDIAKCVLLVELHMFYYTSDWTDGAIRRFLKRFDGDINFLNLLFQLRKADRLGSGIKKNGPHILQEFQRRIQHILEKDAALKVSDLQINGTQLMATLNLSPSPLIGQILNYLLELVLDDPVLNTYETLKTKALLFLEEQSHKSLL
ncbi:MAG: CCA tRNA nucleotidyltransferase [Brevinema sp.]